MTVNRIIPAKKLANGPREPVETMAKRIRARMTRAVSRFQPSRRIPITVTMAAMTARLRLTAMGLAPNSDARTR